MRARFRQIIAFLSERFLSPMQMGLHRRFGEANVIPRRALAPVIGIRHARTISVGKSR
jgi:hypothetical protein